MKKWITALMIGASYCGAQTTTIYSSDFSDSGTYSTGFLSGQNGWNTDGGGGIEVEADLGVKLSGYESAVHATPADASTVIESQIYTSFISFTFDDVSSGNNSAPVVGAAVCSGPDATDSMICGVLKKSNATYRLGLYKNWGTQNTSLGFVQSEPFDPEVLGITIGSDPSSDVLLLSIALTAGTDANSWNATISLFNETTSTLVHQWTPTADNLVFPDLDTMVYGGFTSGQSDSNAQVQSRTLTAAGFSIQKQKFGSIIISPTY